jgi:hypothetical protein
MKIIVSDFDGTLLGKDFEENVKAINDFVHRGNLFVIATGRAMNSLSEDLSLVNLDCEYYICNDGGIIFDRYFNVIYRKDIRQDLVRPIYYALSDDENMIETFVDTSHGYVTDTSKCANGIIARPYDKEKALITLDNILRKYPDINGYMSTNWINIMDKDVSKKAAIDYLLDIYRYKKEDVYTIGDGMNDFSMLEAYQGYTLENSSEDLKSITKGTVKNIKEFIELIDPKEEEIDEEWF